MKDETLETKTIEDVMCEAAYEMHPNDSGAISWRNAASVARKYAERITRERDLWVQVFERAVAATDHQETLDKLHAIHRYIASDAILAEQAHAEEDGRRG
jgi:hypothetical protein